MSATSMHQKKYPAQDPGRKTTGVIAVIVLHILIGWALVTGTARKALDIIKKPMEAAVIQEVIIPPPPPPPPPPPKPVEKPIVKAEAPPPPYVPPAEVTPPPSAAPAVAAVATPPTAPPAPIAPPAPVAPPTPARANAAAVCQTVSPQMPKQALRDGTSGVVNATAVIRSGKIAELQLTGPRVFHAAVREAMSQYTCASNEGQIVTQEFAFKVE